MQEKIAEIAGHLHHLIKAAEALQSEVTSWEGRVSSLAIKKDEFERLDRLIAERQREVARLNEEYAQVNAAYGSLKAKLLS